MITDRYQYAKKFRTGTWTWLMERDPEASFVRHSLVPASDDWLDAH